MYRRQKKKGWSVRRKITPMRIKDRWYHFCRENWNIGLNDDFLVSTDLQQPYLCCLSVLFLCLLVFFFFFFGIAHFAKEKSVCRSCISAYVGHACATEKIFHIKALKVSRQLGILICDAVLLWLCPRILCHIFFPPEKIVFRHHGGSVSVWPRLH